MYYIILLCDLEELRPKDHEPLNDLSQNLYTLS